MLLVVNSTWSSKALGWIESPSSELQGLTSVITPCPCIKYLLGFLCLHTKSSLRLEPSLLFLLSAKCICETELFLTFFNFYVLVISPALIYLLVKEWTCNLRYLLVLERLERNKYEVTLHLCVTHTHTHLFLPWKRNLPKNCWLPKKPGLGTNARRARIYRSLLPFLPVFRTGSVFYEATLLNKYWLSTNYVSNIAFLLHGYLFCILLRPQSLARLPGLFLRVRLRFLPLGANVLYKFSCHFVFHMFCSRWQVSKCHTSEVLWKK